MVLRLMTSANPTKPKISATMSKVMLSIPRASVRLRTKEPAISSLAEEYRLASCGS